MPVSAYVLIQTEVGRAAGVARAAAALNGVASAEGVTGPYDVIARCHAASVDELGRMVVGAIQRIEGILRTITCPVVDLEFAPGGDAAPPSDGSAPGG
jgi:DNA-binding Lrp family transcriptional regulator